MNRGSFKKGQSFSTSWGLFSILTCCVHVRASLLLPVNAVPSHWCSLAGLHGGFAQMPRSDGGPPKWSYQVLLVPVWVFFGGSGFLPQPDPSQGVVLSAAATEINHGNLLKRAAYFRHVHKNMDFHRNFQDLRVSSLYPTSAAFPWVTASKQKHTNTELSRAWGSCQSRVCIRLTGSAKVSSSEDYDGRGTIAGRLTTRRGLSAVF